MEKGYKGCMDQANPSQPGQVLSAGCQAASHLLFGQRWIAEVLEVIRARDVANSARVGDPKLGLYPGRQALDSEEPS